MASTNTGRKQLLATYKLAWIICQKKHPFSAAEDFMEFARLADPDSPVFTAAPDSRRTTTRRMEDIADYILRAELLPSIHQSPYFCLMLDDSLDKATHEQCLLMVRYINVSSIEVVSKFLSIVRIEGTPDAKTIFKTVNQRAVELGLPTDKLICITTDGASVMQGCRNSVTTYILEKWNSFAFKQHCVIHKEVLGVKSALKELPSLVEQTVTKVLGYFKFSSKRNDKFQQLMKLTDPTKLTYKLVQYSKIRWLSLNKCVNGVRNLLSDLNQFFLQESEDSSNTRAVRTMAEDLFVRTNDVTFRLYLEFLYDTLPLLDEINRKLQTPNVNIYKTYCSIDSFRKAFAAPVLKDPGISPDEDDNHIPVSEVKFHGSNFNHFLTTCEESSDLTIEEIQSIRSKCVTFMLTVTQELEQRFPEATFVMNNFAFIDPRNRELRQIDVDRLADRFPCKKEKLLREYATYKFDQNVDDIFQHCKGDIVKFWSTLKLEGYPELSSIAFGILVMSPENATCERAFSVMKYIKNDQRSCLTQLHLDNALRIALEDREPSAFPFDHLLNWRSSHAVSK